MLLAILRGCSLPSGGAIRILNLNTGSLEATPFLTMSGIDTTGEGGFLGLAFHPNYFNEGMPGFGKFYVNVTTTGSPLTTRIREFEVSANPNVASSSSLREILNIAQPQSNHNGGWIGFSPTKTQSLHFFGRRRQRRRQHGWSHARHGQRAGHHEQLVRQDAADQRRRRRFPRRRTQGTTPSHLQTRLRPASPTKTATTKSGRMAFAIRFATASTAHTGDLWIGDVGQGAREEIDFQPADFAGGANYGWRLREGMIANSQWQRRRRQAAWQRRSCLRLRSQQRPFWRHGCHRRFRLPRARSDAPRKIFFRDSRNSASATTTTTGCSIRPIPMAPSRTSTHSSRPIWARSNSLCHSAKMPWEIFTSPTSLRRSVPHQYQRIYPWRFRWRCRRRSRDFTIWNAGFGTASGATRPPRRRQRRWDRGWSRFRHLADAFSHNAGHWHIAGSGTRLGRTRAAGGFGNRSARPQKRRVAYPRFFQRKVSLRRLTPDSRLLTPVYWLIALSAIRFALPNLSTYARFAGRRPASRRCGIGNGRGSLRFKSEGLRVGVLDLTDGEPTPHGSPEIRARETAAATAVLQLGWRENLGLPNRSLEATLDARRQLAEVFRRTAAEMAVRTVLGRCSSRSRGSHAVDRGGAVLVEVDQNGDGRRTVSSGADFLLFVRAFASGRPADVCARHQ